MPRRPLSRRTFLRGTGAALALPLLDAMAPARAAAAAAGEAPTRMAFLYFPNGAWMPKWVPTKVGRDFDLPPTLGPLAPVKDSVLVVSNLTKKHSYIGDGHYAKTANLLTGLPVVKTTGKDLSVGGPSLDQVYAAAVGGETPLPSLELGTDPVISGIDSNVGYTRLYGSYISWRTKNIPLAREINPRFVYERIFGDGTRPAGAGSGDDQMLLDMALEDAKGLRRKLGRDDQFKLDEYMDAVRAVETRLAFFARAAPRPWTPHTRPSTPAPADKIPSDFREHVRLMLDLMVLAFWTDSTRAGTFMFANDVSNRSFNFIDGVKESHHESSHHSGQASKQEQYAKINRWHVEQFAYMLRKMKGIREGERTLLDNSMVMLGSGMSDGNAHDPNNLPIVVGGGAGGRLATGQHLKADDKTPLCNLYVAMLQAAGQRVADFGDSSGVLKGALKG